MKKEDTTKTATGGLLNRSPSALGSQPPRLSHALFSGYQLGRAEAGSGRRASPLSSSSSSSSVLPPFFCRVRRGREKSHVCSPTPPPPPPPCRRRRRRRRRRRSGSPPPPHQTRPQGKVFPSSLLFLPPLLPRSPFLLSRRGEERGDTPLEKNRIKKRENAQKRRKSPQQSCEVRETS